MTDAEQTQAAPEAPPPGPRLIHTGTYALWETPTGGRHVVFCRTASTDEAGQVQEIADAHDEHLPDFPAESLELLSRFLDEGIPAPILAVLQGKTNPLALIRQLGSLAGQAAAGDGGEVPA